MSALAVEPLRALPSVLPGAFGDTPSPTGIEPHPHTVKLVRALVRDLLIGTPEFHALDPPTALRSRTISYTSARISRSACATTGTSRRST